jgi:hypothetical protein
MHRPLRALIPALAVATLAFASDLEAQACLGNASFSTNHLQLNADANFANDVQDFGASFVGGSGSYFAGVGVGGVSYDGAPSSLGVRGLLGTQVPVSSGSWQVCPVLRIGAGFGPSDFDGVGGDLSTRSFGFGFAVGGEMMRSDRLVLVPSLSLGFGYDQLKVSGGALPTTTDDTFGLAGFALGIVISDQLSIRPSISKPVSARNEDPIFGIGIALNYGGRR